MAESSTTQRQLNTRNHATTQRQRRRRNRSPKPSPIASPTPGPSQPASPAPGPSPGNNPAQVPSPGGETGRAVTTRYWDCAKPSCSWPRAGILSVPAKSCDKSGNLPIGDANTMSGADGGTAFTCNDYAPWSVSDTQSYGFAGRSASTDGCCKCYDLTFTNTAVAGKTMTVQVINTGSDLGDGHFDLQMPGGGIGLVNGCSAQWGPSVSWGDQYGGLTSNTCNGLPGALQTGCGYARHSASFFKIKYIFFWIL